MAAFRYACHQLSIQTAYAGAMSHASPDSVGVKAALGFESDAPVRVDVWIWSARIFKTRSLAQTACKKGKVSVDGKRANPATTVKVGARIEVREAQRPRELVVTRLLQKRVGYPIARTAYEDFSPPPPPRQWFTVPQRERGSGRPTKRERREITRLRGY